MDIERKDNMQHPDSRELLRLYLQMHSLIPLPPLVGDTIEVLPEQTRPGWSVCLADLPDERLTLWLSNITEQEREELLERATDGLHYASNIRYLMYQSAQPEMSEKEARSLARRLTNEAQDRALAEAFSSNFYSGYESDEEYQPLVAAIQDGKIVCTVEGRHTRGAYEPSVIGLDLALRQRHALAAAIVWTLEVFETGAVPLWSQLNNEPTRLRLAEKAGYRPFAKLARINDD